MSGITARCRECTRPRWPRAGSSVSYTPAEVRALTPIRESVENLAKLPDLRDVFLCHAWDDRRGAGKELHDLLESRGVRVWFSEKDVGLGVPLLRAIDKGLANSKIGIVLVTVGLPVIAVCAVIACAESWDDIALYGRSKLDWLRTFLELPNGIPSHDTFRRVFMLCCRLCRGLAG